MVVVTDRHADGRTDGMTNKYCKPSLRMCRGFNQFCSLYLAAEPDVISNTTAIVIGAVCSATFLTIGVLVGVVGLYLIQRVRGRSSGPTSSSPPPLPPPVTYEEVGAAREVKSSEDIQLTPNEAYGPVLKDNIPTSHNTA